MSKFQLPLLGDQHLKKKIQFDLPCSVNMFTFSDLFTFIALSEQKQELKQVLCGVHGENVQVMMFY